MSGTAIAASAQGDGPPVDVSYFSLDLTALTPPQIAEIEAGTLRVTLDLNEIGARDDTGTRQARRAIDVTVPVTQALRAGESYYVIGVPLSPAGPPTRREARIRPDDARAARLVVAGRDLPPLADGTRLMFPLPPEPGPMRLISAAAAPRPLLADRGKQGLCVRALFLHGADGRRRMALDDPALGEGWGTIESSDQGDQRWTGGNAAITLPTTENAHLLEIVLQDDDPATLRHAA
jgi:hypothetical protein